MDRRRFNLMLGTSLAMSTRAWGAGEVFLGYDQKAVDDAYDQTKWAPNAREMVARYATDSAEVRKKYPPKTERYGDSEVENLDIFAPQGAQDLPVMVFIHGGAWRSLSKDDTSGPAPTFVDNGCIFIALNFGAIPAVRLPEIAQQCRAAMLWVYKNIARFGGDPNRIFVAGRSSGGHLCAVVATTDWTKRGGPANLLKGAVAMSGMYELYPVMLSQRSSYVKLSPEEVSDLSPLRHMDQITFPVMVVNGDKESPEFQRQAHVFADVLAGMNRLSSHMVVTGKNHFEVPQDLNNAGTDLSKAVLKLMKG
ncbi:MULTISPECIES: alpha/beta hydrolase [unclassified Beijerinckia]|uniref:alpha/beta hydrolase n=1 Tax=unclassified Beijerinckia TaxID=2638183 RepID=UPI000897C7A8|nr:MULTISPECIES: alpha/beta hydrolase [unclassified Beijerinckia]MDH7796297.1 arylformamidase [Beijerinckia sp. GAS462]SEC38918.1 arylformamidase [Beijerinckia sp. 28-YEA-48]